MSRSRRGLFNWTGCGMWRLSFLAVGGPLSRVVGEVEHQGGGAGSTFCISHSISCILGPDRESEVGGNWKETKSTKSPDMGQSRV